MGRSGAFSIISVNGLELSLTRCMYCMGEVWSFL